MSFSDVSSATNFFSQANEGFTTTTSGSTASGATTVGLNSVAGLTNGSVFVGVIEPGETKEQVFTGLVDTAGSQITSAVWVKGTNVTHSTGVSVVDYDTGTHHNLTSTGLLKEHNKTGNHTNITGATMNLTGAGSMDTISEHTAAAGVTVDGVLIKDGAIQTAAALSPVYTTNPYKFSVYRNAAWTTNSAETLVSYDTKTFDTGTNVDVVTNKGRFTAPIAGFYWFSAQAGTTSIGDTGQQYIVLRKNGSNIKTGDAKTAGAAATILFSNISTILQLSANDYIEVFLFSGGGNTGGTGSQVYFEGFLVSAS